MNKKSVPLPSPEDVSFAPDQFRFAAEFSPVHLIFTDKDGVIVYANPAAEKITGYARREMIGKPLRQWGGEMPKEFFDRLWQTVAVDKKVFHDDLTQTRMDGSPYTAEIWISPVITEGTEVTGFVGVEMDVSDRKKLLGDIQESERRFRQITENIKEVFYLVDPKTYEIFYISPAFEDIWGFPVADVYKDASLWMKGMSAEDTQKIATTMADTLAGKAASADFQITRPDGTIRSIRSRTYPVFNEAGKPYRLAGFSEDITAEKETESSLRRFRSLLDQSSEGIEVVDAKTLQYVDVNAAVTKHLGYTREELLKMNIRETNPSITDAMAAEIAAELATGRPIIFETIQRRKDGSTFPVEISLTQANEENRLLAVAIVRDITERKKNEARIKESDVLKNKFIQIVSHQFRTPLSAIRWNLEALMGDSLGALKPEQKEFIRMTHDADVEIIDRVGDLLTAMDIDEERIRIEKSDVSLESLLASVIGTFKGRCTARGVHCAYVPPKKPLPAVSADAEKIRSVFEKLMLNAVNYTPTTGTVTASLIKKKGLVRFELSDTGIGVPLDEQTRLFTRFYRASNASAMIPDASGLGLYLVKYFIKQHGGTIGFASKEGKGSTFWFELPIKQT